MKQSEINQILKGAKTFMDKNNLICLHGPIRVYSTGKNKYNKN